jgi:hypothetical protein
MRDTRGSRKSSVLILKQYPAKCKQLYLVSHLYCAEGKQPRVFPSKKLGWSKCISTAKKAQHIIRNAKCLDWLRDKMNSGLGTTTTEQKKWEQQTRIWERKEMRRDKEAMVNTEWAEVDEPGA